MAHSSAERSFSLACAPRAVMQPPSWRSCMKRSRGGRSRREKSYDYSGQLPFISVEGYFRFSREPHNRSKWGSCLSTVATTCCGLCFECESVKGDIEWVA